MTEHPLSRAAFDDIYQQVPRLTVEVVLDTPDGVVFTKRAIEPCKGQWHLPGGTVHFGEPLRTAVQRVALGELGVIVAVGAPLGYIEYPHIHASGYPGWPIGIAFQAEIVGGELVGGDQSDEIGYFKSPPPNTIIEQAEFLNGTDCRFLMR